jgi:hypothetical protein
MAHHVNFAQIWKVRAFANEVWVQRAGFDVSSGKGKSAPSLLPLFPKKRLVEYQTCGT